MTEPTVDEMDLKTLFQQAADGTLSSLLGMELLEVQAGLLRARLELRRDLLGPTGFVHAATVVALADTCAGMGCVASFPEHVRGFTTIELKSNFIRSATVDEALVCEAQLKHGGRTTQVWDATVTREGDQELLALYRCTQMLLIDRRYNDAGDDG